MTSAVCIVCLGEDRTVERLGCLCRGTAGIHSECRNALMDHDPQVKQDAEKLCTGEYEAMVARVRCPTCNETVYFQPVVESDWQVARRLARMWLRRASHWIVVAALVFLPARIAIRGAAGVGASDAAAAVVRAALAMTVFELHPSERTWRDLLSVLCVYFAPATLCGYAAEALVNWIWPEWMPFAFVGSWLGFVVGYWVSMLLLMLAAMSVADYLKSHRTVRRWERSVVY